MDSDTRAAVNATGAIRVMKCTRPARVPPKVEDAPDPDQAVNQVSMLRFFFVFGSYAFFLMFADCVNRRV